MVGKKINRLFLKIFLFEYLEERVFLLTRISIFFLYLVNCRGDFRHKADILYSSEGMALSQLHFSRILSRIGVYIGIALVAQLLGHRNF